MAELIPRAVEPRLRQFLEAFRVVVINGPRQSGKTTLLDLHRRNTGGELRSLDDDALLRAAVEDPVAFARDARRPLAIDEVQRGGDALVRAIKLVVDNDWTPGQFLLSGSTRFLTIPTLSESLAGRAGFIDLWPLSMAERTRSSLRDGAWSFVDQVFETPDALRGRRSAWSREELLHVIVDGGYPEVQRMPSRAARDAWFDSYVTTVVQRDIREFSHLRQADALPKLLELVAARSGSTTVHSDLARALGNLSPDTIRNYLSYLEMVFLVGYTRPWSTNLTSKVSKTPKAFLTDSGLAAHLLRVTAEGLRRPGHPALGGLVETFVFDELTKDLAISRTAATLHHFRDRDGREVDFVLEDRDGRVVALEVKASSSPPADATRHLTWLRDKLGDRFVLGILLHLGEHTLSYGDRILAVPLSALWDHATLS